ncbi:MAG: VCBS repeat-containing protein [Gemmatimonadota bacterium]|nr:MAG: VCBS repeat-containing protein [Gemmatimonadota bacterium]
MNRIVFSLIRSPFLWTLLPLLLPQISHPTTLHPISFQKSEQVFPGAETYQIALGDVDGDGDLDALFANMGFNFSALWLNDGSGYFVNSGQLLTQQGHGVGLGDLDGDGDLDAFITCANYGSNNNWYFKPSKIYFNDGTGLFVDSGQDLGDTEDSGNGVHLLDIDTDGDLDVHIYYYHLEYTYYHIIYLNDGNGQFYESDITIPNGTELAWGDLDGDEDIDVFVREFDVGFRTMTNDGHGLFTELWQISDSTVVAGDVGLGDFDGDGDLDALIGTGNWERNDSTKVFFNDGTGRFEEGGQRLNPTQWANFLLGDLNNDGTVDAFVNNILLPNEVWLNDGQGNFIDSGLRLSGNEPSSKGSLGDLDADGDLDVFVSYFGRGSSSVWFNETEPTEFSGPYVGQDPPGLTPEIFAPGFISTDGDHTRESDITFWPDGLGCLFARYVEGMSDYTIYETKEVDGIWVDPFVSELFGDYDVFEPGISPDGQKIFFSSTTLTPPSGPSGQVLNIWYIEQADTGWSEPIYFGYDIYASATLDGTVYFTQRIGGKDHIVRRRMIGGEYQPQEIVPSPVYSPYEDTHPCIALDESYLIFDSEDRPRINDCPLFISFRDSNDTWTEPVNMGSLIPMNAALARISPDGQYLFFKSEGDIYWVDARIIEHLKPHETCCECADCNEDGSVDILDALWEVNCILGINPPPCSCDCNQDGSNDVLDVLCIVNIILEGFCP